jgi:hypothetical protein
MKNKYFAPEFIAISVNTKNIIMASGELPDNVFLEQGDDTHMDIFND